MGQTRNLLYASAYRGFDKFAGSEFGQRSVSGAGPEGANYRDVVCSPTLVVANVQNLPTIQQPMLPHQPEVTTIHSHERSAKITCPERCQSG